MTASIRRRKGRKKRERKKSPEETQSKSFKSVCLLLCPNRNNDRKLLGASACTNVRFFRSRPLYVAFQSRTPGSKTVLCWRRTVKSSPEENGQEAVVGPLVVRPRPSLAFGTWDKQFIKRSKTYPHSILTHLICRRLPVLRGSVCVSSLDTCVCPFRHQAAVVNNFR